MKTLVSFILAGTFLFSSVFAQAKKSSPADAEAFVKKAIEFYKSTDKAKALAEFSNTSGKFVKGDLYIFVYDLNGKCLAHGGNPKMVGKDLIDMKDADGKAFVKERVSIIKTKGKGWQNYKWTNPESKQIESKTAYIEKCNDVIIGCGAYKK